MTHSFAVCAYGDSPYLEACLRSLVRQSVPSERLLCTATPSAFLKDLAKKYGFRYCVREGKPGIGADWNFALSQAEGSFVTLAHQDDVYGAHYTEELLRAVKRYPNLALFTSDARILKNGAIQRRSKAECVKKLLRLPLRLPFFKSTTAGKRLSLRLGNPIVCPSCAYRRDLLGVSPFSTSLLSLCGGAGELVCLGASPVALPHSRRRRDCGVDRKPCARGGRERDVPAHVAGKNCGAHPSRLPECLC